MPDITIHIYEASEGGYMYDIYTCDPQDAADMVDAHDGGHCTSNNIENALEMAKVQALALIQPNNY